VLVFTQKKWTALYRGIVHNWNGLLPVDAAIPEKEPYMRIVFLFNIALVIFSVRHATENFDSISAWV
jgi:hypothetical protein